ncbi:MAG: ADP-forming succinate--CoA ligase subunit beta [Sulfolobales archaeon]|nr:ADP-forming succinate--CoA ligase subunit beta [Sulfolobales archaeon]MCX8198775.1 ADP-forming succinate--CoA ligase subunit beta [Sulfolobales archaeon]MDW8169848.1 ADP-forming succinate--CoA ligase subunit beta [Desulfurococcaceae archaeon]
MKLYEYEAKEIVSKHGVKVPRGFLAASINEVRDAVKKLGGEVVLKSQVLLGRRGISGGIRFAKTLKEAEEASLELLKMRISGEEVKQLLVEERICVDKELYLALTIDRPRRAYAILASTLGGVEVEELVKRYPNALIKITVDPVTGPALFTSRWLVEFYNLSKDLEPQVLKIIDSAWRLVVEYDAELVEFNPLALSCSGELIALDVKIVIDDNSLYRHRGLMDKAYRGLSDAEAIAKRHGLSYVELSGNIGILCNGAGLTMATMDLVKIYGGEPANFLDIGGGASSDQVREGVKLLLTNPRVKVILVNVFGGITRCDEVAEGVISAISEVGSVKPIVVRLIGTNDSIGRGILMEKGVKAFSSLREAVATAVELAR